MKSDAARRCFIMNALVAIVGIATIPRVMLMHGHSAYLVRLDEGLEFNRVVEMAQRGDFNPGTVSAPYLNLYLRQPIVLGSYRLGSLDGDAKSLSDIRTRDPHGPRGYAFTASHPDILFWNRSFTALLSIGVVALTFAISLQVGLSLGCAVFAAIIPALSPEILKQSFVVTGDIVVVFLCLACTSSSLQALRSRSRVSLIACGLIAGAAVAASYNVLMVVALPILAALLSHRTVSTISLPLSATIVGFFFASPYALVAPGRVVSAIIESIYPGEALSNQSIGASLAVLFGWLAVDAVGVIASGLALGSTLYFARTFDRRILLFLTFPVVYLGVALHGGEIGASQMLLLIPYVAIMAASGLARLVAVSEAEVVRQSVIPALASLAVIQLGSLATLVVRHEKKVDSRDVLAAFIREGRIAGGDVAIDATLQVPVWLVNQSSIETFDPRAVSSTTLAQSGYRYVVARPSSAIAADGRVLELVDRIPGALQEQEAPDSPAIGIYRVRDELQEVGVLGTAQVVALAPAETAHGSSCASGDSDYCWITARRARVSLLRAPGEGKNISLSVMTPWRGQKLVVSTESGTELWSGSLAQDGVWSEITFPIPPGATTLAVEVSEVHADPSIGSEVPARRIGVAIRTLRYVDGARVERGQTDGGALRVYPAALQASIQDAFTMEVEGISDNIASVSGEIRIENAQGGSLVDSAPAPQEGLGETAVPEPSLDEHGAARAIRARFLDAIRASIEESGGATYGGEGESN
jgi:hypothetical protein